MEFKQQLAKWRRECRRLEEVLGPFVHTAIDIEDPGWQAEVAARPHPADESGTRTEIVALFDAIVDRFPTLAAVQRSALIDLMRDHPALIYLALLTQVPDAAQAFFRSLVLFVIEDQGADTRDAILTLDALRRHGRNAGLDVDPLVRRAADLASRHDRYGWGSTRDLLLRSLPS